MFITALALSAAISALPRAKVSHDEALPAAAAAPAPLVVGTHRVPPFVIANPDGSFSGISIDLWKRVADELGVAYTIKEVEIPAFDKPEESGLDVVVSLNITAKREGIMDLTHAFYSTGLAIAARPEPKSALSEIGSKLYSPTVLKGAGALLLVILLMGVVVWRVERHQNPEDFGGHTLRGIAGGVFWTVESLVGKSKGLSRSRAARILTLAWVFVCTMIVSGVTAKLSSELTLSQLSTTVSGPKDLPKVKVGSVKNSLGARYLDLRSIGFQEYDDAQAALNGLSKGEIDAVVYEAPILQYFVKKDHASKLVVLPGTFLNHGYGFGLRTGSDLRERLNMSLLRFTETDEFKALLSKYLGGEAG
ncbi:MAG: transporter substrate-binding domain-containing protein [Myxococcota bacterium]